MKVRKSIATVIRSYYKLTKPGIIRGNAITAAAGFLLADSGDIDWQAFFYMLAGLSLIIASACVFNNIIDRKIDAQMERTKKRALASGVISVRAAIIFGTVLVGLGAAILGSQTTKLAMVMALVGHFFYVVVYGLGKRKTVHGTLIGSISGAIPPVVGYTAATGSLNLVATSLFAVLTFWQMPHFYSIAIFRLKDYKAANIPVLPAVKGIAQTKKQIVVYIYLFLAAAVFLSVIGDLNDIYLVGILAGGGYWLWRAITGFASADDIAWARRMFGISLLVLLGWSILILQDRLIG